MADESKEFVYPDKLDDGRDAIAIRMINQRPYEPMIILALEDVLAALAERESRAQQ